jgi:hypothetical protein
MPRGRGTSRTAEVLLLAAAAAFAIPTAVWAAKAQLEGLSINAADVIRLALDRLQDQLSEQKLRDALVAHVLKEAKDYPGRAKRGLPREPR